MSDTPDDILSTLDPLEYVAHRGTIPVAGHTQPTKCANYAKIVLEEGITPIDFIFIGANAGHQAMKAVGYFARLLRTEYPKATIGFIPMWLLTDVREDGDIVRKKAQGWRLVFRKDG